ncbi:MAG: oligopeptide:H+ symporter, partial [Planctomycetota bacterium]|nr:oligopeptide:H+ symporter [Planctomycetota bacterium]
MLNALFGKHPRGLPTLFFSEMWERFSFYGMRALLTLYMVNHLGWDKAETAVPIYAAYGALVYAFPVLGGYLANRFLGYRHAILLGGTLMSCGHFVLAIENDLAFYAALALLCVGNGFFKPNISSTVGRLYKEGDVMRDRGFNIFYMGINLGALTAPLVCGQLGQSVDWHLGFGIAGVGMVIGLVQFHIGRDRLDGQAEPENPEALFVPRIAGLNTLALTWILSFAAVPLIAWMFVEPWI